MCCGSLKVHVGSGRKAATRQAVQLPWTKTLPQFTMILRRPKKKEKEKKRKRKKHRQGQRRKELVVFLPDIWKTDVSLNYSPELEFSTGETVPPGILVWSAQPGGEWAAARVLPSIPEGTGQAHSREKPSHRPEGSGPDVGEENELNVPLTSTLHWASSGLWSGGRGSRRTESEGILSLSCQ